MRKYWQYMPGVWEVDMDNGHELTHATFDIKSQETIDEVIVFYGVLIGDSKTLGILDGFLDTDDGGVTIQYTSDKSIHISIDFDGSISNKTMYGSFYGSDRRKADFSGTWKATRKN